MKRVVVMAALSVAAVGHRTVDAQAPSSPIVKIVGQQHKLLLRADGTVAGWGLYHSGQLGPPGDIGQTGNFSGRLVAIALPGRAVDIAAGDESSYALMDDGTVLAWGRADGGRLGGGQVTAPILAGSTSSMEYRGIERPTPVLDLQGVASIAAAGQSAYAVMKDGTVRAWGNGPIGDGRAPKEWGGPPSTAGPAWTPVTVPDLGGVTAVSTSGAHVLALTKDGRVFSWGGNSHGALGRPPRIELSLDNAEEVPGLTDVAQVAAGFGVSTALKKDGTVWVWGSNFQGQFGTGPRTPQPSAAGGFELVPQRVPGVINAVEIALGARHTLVRIKDGSLRSWGNNDWGQAGTGFGTGFQERPFTPKITGVARVFAVGGNSFALRTDGSVWAWGAGGTTDFPLAANTRVPAPAPPTLK